ncbi:MAG TPA: outer membrane lipoprotein carrier protein LolA [Gemmatimonadales bacterium]|nr:outer membrane lipoprotein carrier protein LolA [Gemmatimonadales bacterium]
MTRPALAYVWRRFARSLVVAGLLLFSAAGALRAQQDAKAVVGRAALAYRSLSALRADFDQLIENQMLGNAESKGVLIQSGEAKLSMRFSEPPGEAIVIDGRYVWVYTPSTTPGQVLRLPVPSGGPVYGYNLLAWLLDRPTERYATSYLRADRLDNRSMDVVEMVPTVPDMPFSRATVWIDRTDGLPRRMEIEELSGQRRTLTLHNLRINQPVSANTFTFAVPDGVRVVDQG